MNDEYYAQMRRALVVIREHQERKEFCPKCRYYALKENPTKGSSRGFCTLATGRSADVSLKNTCEKWEVRE